MNRVRSISRKAMNLGMLLLAAAFCAGTPALLAQATQNQDTTPSAPDLQRPAPTAQTPKATASHPAPPTANAPASGTQPGENKTSDHAGDITILPYNSKPFESATVPQPGSGAAQLAAEAASHGTQALLLDRVVAIINGDVILQSDVTEEQHFAVFEPYTVPGGFFTPVQAMQHIVNRSLILQQMREQQITTPPPDAAVTKQLDELRRQIPACAQFHCESEAGWRTFLVQHGFTEDELHQRWKQRMTILQFIEIRFRSGIRIAQPEIADYYNKNIVPQYTARKLPPPPLARVQDRIDEVLLQQRVNVLLGDWLKSLRDAGNVAILDPAYGQLGQPAKDSNADDEDTSGGSR